MTEHREHDVERAVQRDLQAYRRHYDRDLPIVEETARLLENSTATTSTDSTREGFWMRSLFFMRARPWFVTAGAGLIVAAILGIVPISYTHTTGQEVTLRLPGPPPAEAVVQKIASELGSALHAEDVRTAGLDAPAGGSAVELVARVRSRRGTEVQLAADAFASGLTQRGIPAQARVRELRERVSSNVYALAMERAIELRIERAGRTPAQIEADIRAQLEAAGFANPQVQVTQEGDQTQVRVQSESASGDEQRKLELHLDAPGDAPLNASVQQFHVERKPGMTDDDVRAAIEQQMREAGVQGTVTVQNGKIEVRVEKHK